MSEFEVVEKIIKQGGDCSGISCLDCPFYDKSCESNSIVLQLAKEWLQEQAVEVCATPAHYSAFTIQPTEYIMANELNWLQGNVVKYVTRYPLKNGVDDLRKAAHCIEQLIKQAEGE